MAVEPRFSDAAFVQLLEPAVGPVPQLVEVARRSGGSLVVAKVDTDAVQDLAARMGIKSIPTLAVFANGKEAARAAGAMMADNIEAFVQQAIR